MSKRILDIIENGKPAFYIGRRLILPFQCNILKIIAENAIYTEFVGGSNIKLFIEPQNTSIYFRSIGKLSNFLGTYKVIKLIVADVDADLCDRSTHIKFICEIEDDHVAQLRLPDPDMIFIG